VGCEGHLTRRQAAIQLGLRSEFKIRQFERDGVLHAVRGRMGTASTRNGGAGAKGRVGGCASFRAGTWTDADLIALLRQPTTSGRLRTAVDLVTEAKINIARAERVYRFWSKRDETLAARVTRAAAFCPGSRPQTAVRKTASRSPSIRPWRKGLRQACRSRLPRF